MAYTSTHLFTLRSLDPPLDDIHPDLGPILRLRPPRLIVLPYIRPKDRLAPARILTILRIRIIAIRTVGPRGIDDEGLLCDRTGTVTGYEGGGAKPGVPECAGAGGQQVPFPLSKRNALLLGIPRGDGTHCSYTSAEGG